MGRMYDFPKPPHRRRCPPREDRVRGGNLPLAQILARAKVTAGGSVEAPDLTQVRKSFQDRRSKRPDLGPPDFPSWSFQTGICIPTLEALWKETQA